MNEFLEKLSHALGRMSAAQKQEILADYREHFEAGIAAGKTEAEIAAALGDPKQLGRMFKADRAVENAQHSAGVLSVLNMLGAIARYQLLGGLIMFCLYAAAVCTLLALFATAVSVIAAGAACFAYGIMVLARGYAWYAVLAGFLTLLFASGGALGFRGCVSLWRVSVGRLPVLAKRLMRINSKKESK